MKPAVAFIATFAIAVAASTGAKVVLTKPVHAPAVPADSARAAKSDSAKSDSAKTDTALVASGQALSPPPADTARAPIARAADTSKVVAVAGKLDAAVSQAGAPQPPPGPAQKAPTDTVVQASERRIAKVFTAMDAKQAAKVLERMTDNDVGVILGYVGPRQAASIMSALPPERVATLSKLAMQGKKL